MLLLNARLLAPLESACVVLIICKSQIHDMWSFVILLSHEFESQARGWEPVSQIVTEGSLLTTSTNRILVSTSHSLDFLCGSAGKESACNAWDLGVIPGLGRSPGEGKGYPRQYSVLSGEFHALYSPWGHKEWDMTEWLSVIPYALNFWCISFDALLPPSKNMKKYQLTANLSDGSEGKIKRLIKRDSPSNNRCFKEWGVKCDDSLVSWCEKS